MSEARSPPSKTFKIIVRKCLMLYGLIRTRHIITSVAITALADVSALSESNFLRSLISSSDAFCNVAAAKGKVGTALRSYYITRANIPKMDPPRSSAIIRSTFAFNLRFYS